MCSQCLSTTVPSSETVINHQDSNSNVPFSTRLLNTLFLLQPQWFSWLQTLYLQGFSKRRRWRHPLVVRSVLACLLVLYVVIPIWFYLCPWLRRAAVFLHFADWPFQTLSNPENYGLNSTKHFFVETSPGVLLGVWHVLPRNSGDAKKDGQQSPFDDNQLVILYLHGSAESRSAAYRRSMYKLLTNEPLNAHVITFDYRGFGDSSPASPTAHTLEEDASGMYRWLLSRVPASRIVVWGHSMGTGLAVRLGAALAASADDPRAVVLEAPFTSIADATRTFPLSLLHRRMPLFELFCTRATRHPDTNLDSEGRVAGVTAPLMVLHAADDAMVWAEQGRRLWQRAAVAAPFPPAFVELDAEHGCGHRNIHRAPNLPAEVRGFLDRVAEYRKFKNYTEG